jgi:hypothetical protein
MAMTDSSKLSYRLRSTFFLTKLREYQTLGLPALVQALLPAAHLYNWDAYAEWGIGDDALTYISQHPELHLLQVFCHPRVLRERPRLCAYYRNVAALSQKAVQQLIHVDVKRYERDLENTQTIDDVTALALARLLNEHITLIVNSALKSLTQTEVFGLLLASTGAQIDGSWRNAIGYEAERAVQRLLIQEAIDRHSLSALIPRKGKSLELFDTTQADMQVGQLEKYRGIILANQTSILFASDPDISLIAKDGTTAGILEVKGGTDPAGALERFGAALKSFEAARSHNPAVATLLVAYFLTEEVQSRIAQVPRIEHFDLEVLLDETNQETHQAFMDRVFRLVGIESS